jgi:hypothetical protein
VQPLARGLNYRSLVLRSPTRIFHIARPCRLLSRILRSMACEPARASCCVTEPLKLNVVCQFGQHTATLSNGDAYDGTQEVNIPHTCEIARQPSRATQPLSPCCPTASSKISGHECFIKVDRAFIACQLYVVTVLLSRDL